MEVISPLRSPLAKDSSLYLTSTGGTGITHMVGNHHMCAGNQTRSSEGAASTLNH